MSIQALPRSTVRLIGASQAVTDPASIVKELLDNALDAHATAVFIEISANTLDTILVRDNGHGIAPDDREMVCRRYCTSKIREFSDLEAIGGKTLGFRGEALTSIAELSDTFTLTTRVEGEEVAVALKVGRTGEVQSHDHASHPFGTSVRLTNLFENFPVRKQTALRNSARCLGKVTKIVHSYAFARPTVRFSLKILKAKTDKGNWMYSPQPNGNAEDAAFKIVGKECASQCSWSVVSHEGFEVQAFLPAPSANPTKVSNTGHFLSIDARPVSSARGTLKQIITKVKEKLRNAICGSESIKDPFIFLNILCPPSSYDPNVEPAKDDVVFENSHVVLAAVQKLLDSVYPAGPSYILSEDPGNPPGKYAPSPRWPLERPRDRHEHIHGYDSEDHASEYLSDEIEKRPSKRQRTMIFDVQPLDESKMNMIDFDDKSVDQNRMTDDEEDVGVRVAGISVSNPWIIAKMNKSLRSAPSSVQRQRPLSPILQELNPSEINSHMTPPRWKGLPSHSPLTLPTPRPTSPPDESSFIPKRLIGGANLSADGEPGFGTHRSHRSSIVEEYGSPMCTDSEALRESQSGSSPSDRQAAFVSASSLARGTPWSDTLQETPKTQRKPLQRNPKPQNAYSSKNVVNRPFMSPVRTRNSNPDFPYLPSSPPSLASPPSLTDVNALTAHTNSDHNGAQNSPDIRRFLTRVQGLGDRPTQALASTVVEDGADNIFANNIDEGGSDNDVTVQMSTIKSKPHDATANRPTHRARASIDPPERFQPPILLAPNAVLGREITSTELHDLVVTLRISLDVLSSFAARFEQFHLAYELFDANAGGRFLGQINDDSPSTFIDQPPEPEEMEDWRRQLLHFVQSDVTSANVDTDIDIDIEGAVDALIEDCGGGLEQGCGEMEMYGSQGTEMLIT